MIFKTLKMKTMTKTGAVCKFNRDPGNKGLSTSISSSKILRMK